MIKAYRIFTGADGHSHIENGNIHEGKHANVGKVHFEEFPPFTVSHWHNAPVRQYVITLAGILEFTTHGGETCTIHPGEVLVAEDCTGTGHTWRIVNDEPWRRAYAIFEDGADSWFVADAE